MVVHCGIRGLFRGLFHAHGWGCGMRMRIAMRGGCWLNRCGNKRGMLPKHCSMHCPQAAGRAMSVAGNPWLGVGVVPIPYSWVAAGFHLQSLLVGPNACGPATSPPGRHPLFTEVPFLAHPSAWLGWVLGHTLAVSRAVALGIPLQIICFSLFNCSMCLFSPWKQYLRLL